MDLVSRGPELLNPHPLPATLFSVLAVPQIGKVSMYNPETGCASYSIFVITLLARFAKLKLPGSGCLPSRLPMDFFDAFEGKKHTRCAVVTKVMYVL